MWGIIAAPENIDQFVPIDAASALATTTATVSGTLFANTGFSTMDFFGLFNIFVGLMIVASILIFGAGLITWMVRIGTIARVEGIRVMEWGVVILFVLLVLLAIVQFFQRNSWVATFFISLVIICFILGVVMQVSKSSGTKKEE